MSPIFRQTVAALKNRYTRFTSERSAKRTRNGPKLKYPFVCAWHAAILKWNSHFLAACYRLISEPIENTFFGSFICAHTLANREAFHNRYFHLFLGVRNRPCAQYHSRLHFTCFFPTYFRNQRLCVVVAVDFRVLPYDSTVAQATTYSRWRVLRARLW